MPITTTPTRPGGLPPSGLLPEQDLLREERRFWLTPPNPEHPLRWMARDRKGRLAAPPAAHVLEHLVLTRLLHNIYDLDPALSVEVGMRRGADTVIVEDEPPGCDLCARAGRSTPARYDVPTKSWLGGRWANLCGRCYPRASDETLGTGHGQYLLAEAELTPTVLVALARARDFWVDHGIPASEMELSILERLEIPQPAGR